jgi:hypothetical protein
MQGTIDSPNEIHAWLGLKNSDDIGTNFDLRAEVYKNGMPVGSGEIYCIQGVTRNADKAKEVTVSFSQFQSASFNGTTDVLSLRILTRIGTDGAGGTCGGHSNAVGLRLYFDAQSRSSRFDGETIAAPNAAMVARGGENAQKEMVNVAVPNSFAAYQNYPNPFNPSTSIHYDLPKDGFVTLKIYNSLGQEVAILVNGFQTAGTHAATFRAQDLASGVYFYRLQAGNFVDMKKMLLLK